MRTRFSSHPFARATRPVLAVTPSDFALDSRAQTRASWQTARRLTLALAASAPLCAGALWAGPAQAAPTVESDENGPLVQIVKPGYNDVLKGNYRILIQVTARKYNPQSVEMFIDDESATTGPMEISSFASSSYNFDTRLLTEGRHKLTVRVTDSQGFRGWSEVTVFVNNKGVVDTQTPDLRWVGIEPFQEVSGALKLEVDAADNFGVKMLQISINPADSPNKPAYSWMMNQPPYSVNFDTIGKNIPDGLYVLKALAWDSLDQQGEAPPLTFGIVNNQISATRVQDMLDGQRQMQKALAGEKLTVPAPQKPTEKTATEAPAIVLPAATPAASAPVKTPIVTEKVAPATEDAATGRSSVPATPTRAVPESAPTISAPSLAQQTPRVAPPTLNIAPPTLSNHGIQLPRVNVPQTATPDENVAPVAEVAPTENAPTTDETRIAQATPTENIAPTEIVTPENVAPIENVAPEATTPTEDVATEDIAPIENVAPQRSEETRIAMTPSRPVSQRNGGQASMSHAAAIELAVAAPGGALIESVRSSAPIAVARFSQPGLAGRNVAGAPVLSQRSANDESRLSNAELSRLRSSKTRVLGAARGLSATSQPTGARALQISAPALAPRPILGRAVTADSIKPPAPKLTRQAQNAAVAPAKTSQPVLSGTLSKTVLASGRRAPIAPTSVKPTEKRGLISQTAPDSQRAVPQVAPAKVAPTRVANTPAVRPASAPQMSAPIKPQMSESASGLNVPQRSVVANAAVKPAKSLDKQRVVALPRPDAATSNRGGASIVAMPLEIADSSALSAPSSYRAERNTTLRAVAARFGLPVELVAISNNLTTDAKITSGQEVKLPRPLQVSYNGTPVTGDAPSMLMGDTAVTAFRFMFEKTGGKMEWDATNQRVVARKDGREITLTIGSNVAKVGEREVAMEIAAFLFQGRTMVPLRFFEEGLNAQVEWNPQTGRLVVAMAG